MNIEAVMPSSASRLGRIGIVGVIGAGVMGTGIAEAIILAGKAVVLMDRDPAALERANDRIKSSLDHRVRKGKLEQHACDAALNRLTQTTEHASFASADLAIEAASESIEIKTAVLRDVSDVVGYRCIIATNTSSLSVAALAKAVDDPTRFIGIHFFNPAALMPLVEVVSTSETSSPVVTCVTEFLHEIGKDPIEVKDSPGFVVNRLLIPMINEAFHILGEGVANAQEIDFAMRAGSNHPIGPLALADLIGLDVCAAIIDSLKDALPKGRIQVAPELEALVKIGHLGKKTGRGVYEY
jgi:3-hydroxybutyryl-CoA dehydrogenase